MIVVPAGVKVHLALGHIETCKLNDVEPYAYLHDVLTRMVDGHPINRLDELLPWDWKARDSVKSGRKCGDRTLTVSLLLSHTRYLRYQICHA
jgi:hypothetical protein